MIHKTLQTELKIEYHESHRKPASSTTKTGRYDIAKLLPKMALNTKNQICASTNITCITEI